MLQTIVVSLVVLVLMVLVIILLLTLIARETLRSRSKHISMDGIPEGLNPQNLRKTDTQFIFEIRNVQSVKEFLERVAFRCLVSNYLVTEENDVCLEVALGFGSEFTKEDWYGLYDFAGDGSELKRIAAERAGITESTP